MQKSRTNSVIKNAIWELGYYIVVVLIGFLAPRYIILIYGSAVNGLSATITQILNVILLLQAGAATAAIYSLFKPIADNNLTEVCTKLSSATKYFKKLSLIFLGLMLIAAIVTAFGIDSEISATYIFIAFVIMGMKSFLDLYFTSTYRILFTAFQEKFVMSIATLIEQIVYYVLVFVTLFFHWHFILLFFWLFLGCVVKITYLNRIKVRKHPELNYRACKSAYSTSYIAGKNYALANELAHSVMTTSSAIMISFMYGLKEASVYSIYSLVFSALYLIMTSLNSSFAPSFGNLYASGNIERAKEVFYIFQFIYLMMNVVMMMCTIFLLLPFVSIYISGVQDINYHNESLVILTVLSSSFSAFRVPYNVMVSSLGFFKETWLQPVLTCICCLLLSYFMGRINYAFIILGPVVFYLVNFLYQHIRLKELVPQMIDNRVLGLLVLSLSLIGLSYLLYHIVLWDVTITSFVIATVISVLVSILLVGIMAKIFFASHFDSTVVYLKTMLRKDK